MTTTILDPKTVAANRRTYSVDAKGLVLGRLATRIATVLRGKHKPTYTPTVDSGDTIIVSNVADIRLTGNKIEQKEYFRHSGYARGAKVIPVKRQMEQDPTKVLYLAVKRMLDDNTHRSRQLKRLRMFAGAAPKGMTGEPLPTR